MASDLRDGSGSPSVMFCSSAAKAVMSSGGMESRAAGLAGAQGTSGGMAAGCGCGDSAIGDSCGAAMRACARGADAAGVGVA